MQHYEIGAAIGQGAFSSVYACRQVSTGSICAAKIVSKKRFKLVPSFRVENLFREAEILMSLQHPNILQVCAVMSGGVM